MEPTKKPGEDNSRYGYGSAYGYGGNAGYGYGYGNGPGESTAQRPCTTIF